MWTAVVFRTVRLVIARLIRMGVFETVKKALERVNEEPVARFSALFFSFASLASNVKHPIHQKMLDNQLVNSLEIIQASECEYAVFHASLALAVLQTNKEIKTRSHKNIELKLRIIVAYFL